ncbi:MAG: shikimate dehydrogenase [Propionibacteriaceae bacterium]|jgi:shikimate dehydrogenase|nr:shikimate dehydrogenase [Propionibacteriaceae bacterium]
MTTSTASLTIVPDSGVVPAPGRRCGVAGSPIAHSLSPVLHREAYRLLGLPWEYTAHEVTKADLADFLAGLDERWRGLSCTMPLKEAIVARGEPDETVRALGVANTMVFDGRANDPATTRLLNTDVVGIESALEASGAASPEEAVVLGTGATAHSLVYALARTGAGLIHVLGRDPEKVDALVAAGRGWGARTRPGRLGDDMPAADLVVSTVPSRVAALLAPRIAKRSVAVFDILYDPWPTPLITEAQAARRVTITGLDLLVHQAIGQVEAMTGGVVEAEPLFAAAHAALRRRRLMTD